MSDTIRNLIHSSEHGYKPYFQPQATQIVQAIRVMLYSSGTVDKDSAPIRMHKELKLYHRQIMAALSKLVLSARMASSTWASEAATTKMQVDANDVAHSVNQFIQTAQAAQVKVHEVDAKIIPNPDSPVADPAKRLSRVLSNSYRASAESAERSQARAVGSAGVFAHLDYYSKSVFKALTLLALQIKTALGPNSTNTSSRAQSASCPILSSAQSSQIVMQCHQTISHLSSLLALVSDFYTIALRDHALISDQFFLDVRSTKQVLYNNVAALVMTIQLATDPMAQATVLEMTLSAAVTAEKSCLEMVASTRALASECEIAENIIRLNDGISNMQTSDKRTSGSSTQHQHQRHNNNNNIIIIIIINNYYTNPVLIQELAKERSTYQDETKVTRNRSSSQLSSFSIGSSYSNTSQPTTPGTEYSGAYPFPNCNYGHGQGGAMVSTQLSSSAASIMSYRTDRPMSPMSDNMSSQLQVLTQRANMETRERDTRREKLRKMLGSDVPMPKPKKKPVENPWYLGHDYSMADISFNMEGHVKGGTLPALVERLTLHDGLDSNFVATFLLTYRSFASTEELFTLLFRRFSVMAPVGLDEYEMEEWTRRKLTPIRLRVMNIIKSWLEAYYLEDEEEDRQILPRIKEFCEANLMHETISFTAVQLMKLVEKRETSDGSFRRMVLNLSTQAPQPITPRNLKRIRFMDLDPLELARQLTILETNIYNQVRPVECLGKAWTSSDPVVAAKAVNIKKIIETSNSYANWINEIVLSEPDIKKRAAILKHLVAVAEKLRQLNNFSTLSTTTAALSLSPIHRLKRTWEIVPSKTMNTLAALGKLTSSARNWADYRVEIHSVNPPCVPFVGVYLTDLVMIEDGNPDILARTENHINFKKRVGVAEVIREIQQYQNVPYCLTVVPEIQAFIRRGLDKAKNVSELYDMSLALEPRIRPVTGIPPPNVPVPQMTAAGPGPSPGNSGTSSSGPGSANASTFSLSSS
ncbi:hypothetical protein BG006_006966 [Podila minutissima]|uniref:Uncharacterized protein n=1 Tax=Podila minutissima TaxID=64525 RepID=A0A9P5VL20_9FUNG|nr:hypothetical protein BG006_006966 [Podila minutissima]